MAAKRVEELRFKGEPITGKTFGGWTVLHRVGAKKLAVRCVWCGLETERYITSLYSKNTHGCITCRNRRVILSGPSNGFWKGTGSGRIPGSVMCKIRASSKRGRVLECSVTLEYLEELMNKQGWRCPYSGRELVFGSGPNNSGGNASLDRVDSAQGYIEGNVMWVDVSINRAKWEMSPEEFTQLCADVYRHSVASRTQGEAL